MGRHFLELTDAATLETEHYLLARRAVLDAVESCAMAVIHGSAGLGKTYAVDELVHEQGIRVLWTSFPSRPTTRAVAANLYELLAGRRTRLDRFTIITRLVEQLAHGPDAVVVDESQLLTGDCIELLRYLHDHRATRFALVLVGGNGTWAVLSREPMLASRVYRRVRFQSLRRADVLRRDPRLPPRLRHRRQRADRVDRRPLRPRQPTQLGRVHPQRSRPARRNRPRAARRADHPQRLRAAQRWRAPLTHPSP